MAGDPHWFELPETVHSFPADIHDGFARECPAQSDVQVLGEPGVFLDVLKA